jgi:hypothetical protein
METDHDLGYALFKRFAVVIAERLEATRIQLLDIYGKALQNKNTVVTGYDPMLPRQFRITRFKRETSDTFSMEFEPVSEKKPFNFEPGQFNMLYIFGVGEIPISISGDPTCPEV